MIRAEEMWAELGAVLDEPRFVRSPVQSRLLSFLVEQSIQGRGKELSSYALGVDGLGRSPEFDSQTDSYARVQVGRLRKSLDSFYATAGALHPQRLLIESGSYEVKLAPNRRPDRPNETTRESNAQAPANPFRRYWLIAAVLAVFILAAATTNFLGWKLKRDAAQWTTDDFPTVEIAVRSDSETTGARQVAEIISERMQLYLNRYESIRISTSNRKRSDYLVHIRVSIGRELRVSSSITDRRRGALIWSQQDVFSAADEELVPGSKAVFSDLAFRIAHPTGFIHANERRYNRKAKTPYGCWLQFSTQLYNNHTIGDRRLADCAKQWHEQTPHHPIATSLYGWSMIDSSISQVSSTSRNNQIRAAIELLEDARALNPNSVLLQITVMRAQAFAGNRSAAVAAANQAVELNPENLDVLGFAGMILALQDRPEGGILLEKAIVRHFNPPPWYFVGQFVSAMMRDDVVKARNALEHLRALKHSLPLASVLSAAYEARIGQLMQARRSWNEATRMQPVLQLRSELFFERLPVSPGVRNRLKQWLAPVLTNPPASSELFGIFGSAALRDSGRSPAPCQCIDLSKRRTFDIGAMNSAV